MAPEVILKLGSACIQARCSRYCRHNEMAVWHLGRYREHGLRMETMSRPGRVNLSETIYDEIKDEFACEYRGEIEVKYRGLLKMYFVL